MISLILFLAFMMFSVLGIILNIIKNKKFQWDFIFTKQVLIPLLIALFIFICASIIPYSLQMNDQYKIAFAQENIKLYNSYIDDYTSAAQKQISEYQKFQSEMARSANAIQLQYYSQQIDAVGNNLTNQIKVFNDKILEWKIEINRASIKMQYRPKNKWVFGL